MGQIRDAVADPSGLTAFSPGATMEEVRAGTGRELRVAGDPEATAPPGAGESEALRALEALLRSEEGA